MENTHEACHSGLFYYIYLSATGKLQFWLSTSSVIEILAKILVCVSMHGWFGGFVVGFFVLDNTKVNEVSRGPFLEKSGK